MATEAPTTFGALLKRFRVAAGMTQEMLAERAGMSVRGLSDLERARRVHPHYETVRLLASALALSPDDAAALLAAARPVLIDDPPAADLAGVVPVPLTPLIGREAECSLVSRRLATSEVRLVTLTGPGGVGKTRLALAVAEEARATFADAVWFVSLAALRDPAQVLSTVAAAVGLAEGSDEMMLQRLSAHLRPRRGLLVLDNFEHLLPAAPAVGALLSACPALKAVVTSRAVLRVSGEHEFRVAPLAVPPLPTGPLPSTDFAAFLRIPAIQLLVERLAAVDATYVPTAEDAPALAEICARVDGLPLGIELAAAQSRYFALSEIAARLRQPASAHLASLRDLPPRQRSLDDTIAWSYDVLPADQQRVFRYLAVFVGGWTLAQAEALLDALEWGGRGVTSGSDVVAGLAALIDASLVTVRRDAEGQARYGMLETIREFAERRLIADGEEAQAREAHANLLLAISEQMERGLQSGERTAWSRVANAELDNMRAALRWSLARGDPERALRMVGNLDWFWDAVGRDREGLAWGRAALALPALDRESLAYGRALSTTGALAWNASEFASSFDLLTESVAILRRHDDPRSLGEALFNLSMTARYIGEDALARTAMREGLALLATLDEPWLLGAAYFGLGEVLYPRNPREARAAYARSLDLYRALGDPWGTAHALNGLGGLAMRAGEYAAARAYMEEALALRRAAQNPHAIATSLISLGELARREGDTAQARAFLAEGLSRFHELGDDEHVAWALYNLALVALRERDTEAAREALAECLSMRAAQGNAEPLLHTLAAVARLAVLRGEVALARQLHRAVESLRAASGFTAEDDRDQSWVDDLAPGASPAAAGPALTLAEAVDLGQALLREYAR